MQSNFLRCCFQRRSICRGKELIHAGSRSGSGTGAHITVHVNVKPICRSLFIRSCTKKIVNQYLVSLGLSSMFPNCFSWWRTYRLLWLMNGLDSHLSLLDIFHLYIYFLNYDLYDSWYPLISLWAVLNLQIFVGTNNRLGAYN